MHGSKYFAKIDAKSGFYQLTLAEESRYVTTFITPRGCFRFKRTPFGVSDANEAFQRMMEQILFGIIGVRISIDDVIVHAATMKELVSRLRKVFERCREYNLKLNRSKCEFGVSQISVLGHIVSADGIKPDPKKPMPSREHLRRQTFQIFNLSLERVVMLPSSFQTMRI